MMEWGRVLTKGTLLGFGRQDTRRVESIHDEVSLQGRIAMVLVDGLGSPVAIDKGTRLRKPLLYSVPLV